MKLRSVSNLGARASRPHVLACARPAGKMPALPGLHFMPGASRRSHVNKSMLEAKDLDHP
jgi:hypothetical protein